MEVVSGIEERASVLVVDDNPLIRSVVQSLFQLENYQVSIANNGQDALGILATQQVDVIVCDVMMPRMDGYEFFDSVRANDQLSHIPFLFLTALDTDDEVKKGNLSGCDGYLTKPFDPETLISTVHGKVLRSRNIKRSVDQNHEKFRKRVLHTLSHEFRTPLVAINTGSEMLLDDIQNSTKDPEAAKTKKLIEAIYRGGQRLERLVNDFMLLQQIEAGVAKGMFEKRSRDCCVGSILNCFLSSIDSELSENEFIVNKTLLCPDKKIKIYEPQVVEILKRVAENSIKFSENIKQLDIAAYCNNEEVIISIGDYGIGFDPVKIKNSINAFSQIDRDKLEQQGGGLGLAIASKYAEINGAYLSFERREKGGAVVSLHLPLTHCPSH